MEHLHHIVPRYRCKQLDIDPDFQGNHVMVTRYQHALIHWGYYCNDLSPLLEVCNPPQEILDMIPLGQGEDANAAVLLAEHEIDGITPPTGEDNPSYKHGRLAGVAAEYSRRSMEGTLDEWDKRDEYNRAYREYKRWKNSLNDEYSQRERQRKLDNYHRWPSSIARKEAVEERRRDKYGTSTLEDFMK